MNKKINKRVVTIGGATQDAFIHYDPSAVKTLENTQGCFLLFEEGSKIEVSSIAYATGGGATNSAVSFKRMSFDVTTFVKLGNDDQANFIIAQLHHENISLAYSKSFNKQTGTSFIFPCPSGDRIIFTHRGANGELGIRDIDQEIISCTDVLFITPITGKSSQLMLPITRFAKEHNILIATNPSLSQLLHAQNNFIPSFNNIDILILNKYEAATLMNTLLENSEITATQNKFNESSQSLPPLLTSLTTYKNQHISLSHFFKEVISRGPSIVAVTNGKEGVYVGWQDTIYFHPSIPVTIVNTVGAGDAFGSCFVGSIAQGYDLKEALRFGIINASSVISYENATDGLLTFEQLEQCAKHIDKQLLQIFSIYR